MKGSELKVKQKGFSTQRKKEIEESKEGRNGI